MTISSTSLFTTGTVWTITSNISVNNTEDWKKKQSTEKDAEKYKVREEDEHQAAEAKPHMRATFGKKHTSSNWSCSCSDNIFDEGECSPDDILKKTGCR
jgi:hypothetical protein